MPTLSPNEQLLAAIKIRSQKSTEFNYGILTADRYMQTLQDCVGSDMCNRFCSKGNLSWNDQIKRAASTLTYNNEDMVVEDQYQNWKKDFSANDMHGNAIELPKNTLMVFKHTLTSPKKDRDGDMLRTKGARPDPHMLMIWQHQHTLPIGKMLGIAEHTAKKLSPISAIVDINSLAHDSAVMIDNKMGRFSHGFRALEFSEVKEIDDHGRVTTPGGFDIKSFEIMEESLVSVPSNTDAQVEEVILSLVSGGKMTSPWMKSYGKTIKNKRPLSLNVPMEYPLTKAEAEVFSANFSKAVPTQTKCGCGCNGAPGGCGGKPTSEEANDDEHEQAKSSDKSEVGERCPGCGEEMSGKRCSKCGYTQKEKSVGLDEKAGRVLSAKNFAKVSQALSGVQYIADNELLITPTGKTKAQEAVSLLSEVIAAATIVSNVVVENTISTDTVERSFPMTVKDAMVVMLMQATQEEKAHLAKTLSEMIRIDKKNEQGEKFLEVRGVIE